MLTLVWASISCVLGLTTGSREPVSWFSAFSGLVWVRGVQPSTVGVFTPQESANANAQGVPPQRAGCPALPSTPLPTGPREGLLYTSPTDLQPRSPFSCAPIPLAFLNPHWPSFWVLKPPCNYYTQVYLHRLRVGSLPSNRNSFTQWLFIYFISLCLFQNQRQHKDFFKHRKAEICSFRGVHLHWGSKHTQTWVGAAWSGFCARLFSSSPYILKKGYHRC